MKKQYTIKFYEQKDGQRALELERLETYAFSNKDAYKTGREKLANMAKHFINNYDGADDDSRLIDAQNNLASLQDRTINTYYEDIYTYSFKVFSKKIK